MRETFQINKDGKKYPVLKIEKDWIWTINDRGEEVEAVHIKSKALIRDA